jgi:hypothetical protein
MQHDSPVRAETGTPLRNGDPDSVPLVCLRSRVFGNLPYRQGRRWQFAYTPVRELRIADENGVREDLWLLSVPATNGVALLESDSRFQGTAERNREPSLQILPLDVHSGPEAGIASLDWLLGR